MANEWFYSRNGQQQGPVTLEVLRQLLQTGQVTAAEMVWSQHLPNWVPAAQVPELWLGAAAAPFPPHGYAPPPGYNPQQGYVGPMNYSGVYPQQQQTSGTAVGALVCSLVGLCVFGPVMGLIAVILGAIAIAHTGPSSRMKGRGMAIAGLIIGIIDIPAGIFAMMWYMHHGRF